MTETVTDQEEQKNDKLQIQETKKDEQAEDKRKEACGSSLFASHIFHDHFFNFSLNKDFAFLGNRVLSNHFLLSCYEKVNIVPISPKIYSGCLLC